MFKKVLLLFIVLVLVAVGGVTVYLNNIDWNLHKDKISQQFSQATGKEVVFNGPVRFSLFPSPYLEAADISIYNRTAKGEKLKLAQIKKLVSTLSVSSLMGGSFHVERMSLVEPEFFVEMDAGGKLNWISTGGNQQNIRIDNVEISLNSLTVEKAKMHLVKADSGIHAVLDNMNAEIIAQSLFGPYRIEGSYVKDNSPGGFAVSLGQFSESFATSVNAVISHPQSESYVRFDGTVLLNNDAVNGNLIFESKNPVNFLNTNVKGMKISEDYEHPVALSMELKTDKSQISLGNIVIKYAGSAGAGNILIPRTEEKIGDNGMERRKVDAVFNMTEFNLETAVLLVRDFVKKYDLKENYMPEYDFDVIADLKALKTTYNGQIIRDFDLSVDFVDNILKIQNLSATMPGETMAKLSGEVFPIEKKLTYNFKVNSSANDFSKFADWLKLNIKPISQGTYKKTTLSAIVEGTTDTIKIAPFDFLMDKSAVNGKIGIVRGDKTRWFVIANADNINFDNYIAPLSAEEQNKPWRERLAHRFAKLAFLKDVDLQFVSSLKSGIFEKIPFENLEMEAVVRDGIMKIADASVMSVAGGDFSLKGELRGFGKDLQLKNMRYKADINNLKSFTEKFGIDVGNINLANLSRLNASGVVTGSMDRAATKSIVRLGDIDFAYHGEISYKNKNYYLGGKTEVRAPSFVKMLNDFSVDYDPNYPLGLFKMSADVKTSGNVAVFDKLNANVGVNNFSGNLIYQKKENRNQLKADLKINRFEFEKFFYNVNRKNEKNNFRNSAENATFLVRPRLSQMRINYDWLKNWDVNLQFAADTLSLNATNFSKNAGKLQLRQNVLKLSDFVGEYSQGLVKGNLELNLVQDPLLSGKVTVKGLHINKDLWSGSVYGLTGGILNSETDFRTSAVSVESLLNGLSGTSKFEIKNPIVKGWNFEKIEADLAKRDVSDGFAVVVRDALGQGTTEFTDLKGEWVVNNGVFAVNNARFSNNSYYVDFVSDGSIKDWTQETAMKAVYTNEKIPGFDFSYGGSIGTPVLSVDVSKATKVFDGHWAKLEAEAKAKEKARKEKYNSLMNQRQQKAQLLYETLSGDIVPVYDTYSKMAKASETKKQYAALSERIKAANNALQEVFLKNNVSNIDDGLIARLEGQNKKIETEIKQIEAELNRIHLKDVKLRISDIYNKIFKVYNQSKTISTASVDAVGNFEKRLAAISTDYYIKSDKSVAQWQKKIEKGLVVIDQINSDVAKDNISIQNLKDLIRLESYCQRFNGYLQDVTGELDLMSKAAEEMRAYLEGKVSAEEKSYADWLKEQEIKRKMQENTGQISSGGKTVTVGRDLDEIRKAEEAVKKQKVKVLDFSDEGKNETEQRGIRDTGNGIIVKQ